MARTKSNSDAKALRTNVSAFLRSKSNHRIPLLDVLRRLAEQPWSAVLFGGTLRDLMVYGPAKDPRDVDVVVDGASVDELSKLFGDILVRKTRFGGLHLNNKGWMIDLWPLSDTWAVRERRAGAGDFEALTRTTFLNVEAVVFELKMGRGRRVLHSSGFFEAIQRCVLDINLEENPFPELAAIRTLITAAKLRYSLSRRLARYVIHHTKKTPFEQLVSIQLQHYGKARLDEDRIRCWTETLRKQLATGSPLRMPVAPVQLTFWSDAYSWRPMRNTPHPGTPSLTSRVPHPNLAALWRD